MANSGKCLIKYREQVDKDRLNKGTDAILKNDPSLSHDEAMIKAAEYILSEYKDSEQEILDQVIAKYEEKQSKRKTKDDNSKGNVNPASIESKSVPVEKIKQEDENLTEEKPNKAPIEIIKSVSEARPFEKFEDVRKDALAAVKEQTGKDWSKHEELKGTMMLDPVVESIHEGRQAGINRYAKSLPVSITADAIPKEKAYQAFQGTSFSPEKRADSARNGYVNEMVNLWRSLEKQYQSAAPELQAAYLEKFQEVADRYASLTTAYLSSRAHVMSSMITGPANFPIRRNEKANRSADNKMQAANEYFNKAEGQLKKILRGKIDNSLNSELAAQEKKLENMQTYHAKMKAVNVALRKGNDQALRDMGYSDAEIAQLKEPDYAGRTGIPAYQLTNNNANIKRVEDRIADLKKRIELADKAEAATEEDQGDKPFRMVQNAADNRLQLFFDDKPDEATRNLLKSKAFRWSPKNGAWQRDLTGNSIAAAEEIAKKLQPSIVEDKRKSELLQEVEKYDSSYAEERDGYFPMGEEHKREQIKGEIPSSINSNSGKGGLLLQNTDNGASGGNKEYVKQDRPDNEGVSGKISDSIKFSKSSNITGKGIPVSAIQRMVTKIADEYKGLPKVNVLASVHDAPAGLIDEITRQKSENSVEGAFYNGEIYLFANHLSSIDRAEFVLAEHELTHVGLGKILGEDGVAKEMGRIYRFNDKVRKLADKYNKDGVVSIEDATEEVLANMSNQELSGLRGWKSLVAKVASWLDKNGFHRVAKMLGNDQFKADQYVAKLVKAARDSVKTEKPTKQKSLTEQILDEVITDDEVFKHPHSDSTNLKEIVRTVAKGFDYDSTYVYPDGVTETMFTMSNDLPAKVLENDKEVWVDVSGSESGKGTGALYAAVGNYAYNTGKIFIDDPAGVSSDAVIRRPVHMLSLALRYGTTKFLGKSQNFDDKSRELGLPVLDWSGSDEEKLNSLLRHNVRAVYKSLPELRNVQYDFKQHRFTSKLGRGLPETWSKSISRSGAARANRIGESTIRRAVFIESIASSPRSEKSRILEHYRNDGGMASASDRQVRGLLSRGNSTDLWSDAAEIPRTTAQELLDKLKFAGDKGRITAKQLGLSALTQNQLVEIGAEVLPMLKQFGVERNHYDTTEAQWHRDADKIANRWEKLAPNFKRFDKVWKTRNRIEQMRIADVMHDMTVSGDDPRKASNPNDELQAKYNKLLPESKKLLDDVEDFHKRVTKELVRSITDKIMQSEMPSANKDELIRDITDKFKTVDEPYFPLMRFGQYWVDYNGGVQFFETKAEQDAFIKQSKQAGTTVNGFGKSLQNFNKVEGVDVGFVDNVNELIDKLDVDQAEQLKDGIFQLYLTALPETSMRKRFIHRKKTPGWEQDALRSFAKKAFHDGKQLAKLKYAPKMRKVLSDAEEIVKIGNSDRQLSQLKRRIALIPELLDPLKASVPFSKLRDMYDEADDQALIRKFNRYQNASERQDAMLSYLDDQNELLKSVNTYKESGDTSETAADILKALHKSYANMMESNTSPVTNFINQSVFTYFLGFNPSSAIINYFQTPGVALPVIAGRHGFLKASKAMADASKAFFTNRDADGFSIRPGLKDPGEISMYNALTANGTFDRTRSHDLAGLSEEGIKRGTLHRDFMMASTYMFHAAEVANREITALTAYRMEYAKTGNVTQSIQYANDVVRDTHLDYSSANRPDLFQGNAARVMLQFKMYSQGMTYLWGKTAYDAMVSKNPERKAEAKNILLSLIGVQTAAAGLLGLPIGGILLAASALAGLGDDDDDPVDIEIEIRKALSNVFGPDIGRILSRGVLSETGADFHGRLSMSDLWFREPDRELEGKDQAYYLLKTVVGPVGGLIENMAVGMKLIGDGHAERGLENILPNSVKGAAKAYRMIDEGGATSLTGNMLYETSAYEKALQALGMRPSGLAERQLQNSAIKNREMAITDTKSTLLNRAALAKMKGDDEAFQETWSEIKDFNAKYPSLRITPATINKSVKSRRRSQGKAEDGLVVRPKLRFIRGEESFL